MRKILTDAAAIGNAAGRTLNWRPKESLGWSYYPGCNVDQYVVAGWLQSASWILTKTTSTGPRLTKGPCRLILPERTFRRSLSTNTSPAPCSRRPRDSPEQ